MMVNGNSYGIVSGNGNDIGNGCGNGNYVHIFRLKGCTLRLINFLYEWGQHSGEKSTKKEDKKMKCLNYFCIHFHPASFQSPKN